ncbi:MAG: RNB domain-containing ribonuclease [Bacilli bacterium]|nr:RNB domain-containing ribonuclease [Bacilli bacterium]
MNPIRSKEIKHNILKTINSELEDLKIELNNYLEDEENQNETLKGMLNAIFVLLSEYLSEELSYLNKDEQLDYVEPQIMFNELIKMIEDLNQQNLIKDKTFFIKRLLNFNEKIDKVMTHEEKDQIKEPYLRLNDILNNLQATSVKEETQKHLKYIKYLVFQEKELNLFEKYITMYPDVLSIKDELGNNLFETIFKKYIAFDKKKQSEIDYYFHIIMLLLNSTYGDIFLNQSKKLVKELKLEHLIKDHVYYLVTLLDEDAKLSLSDIESQYKIKFSFPEIIINETNSFIFQNKDRINFTNQPCITIDGEGTCCLDDAIYIEKNIDNTFNLYIYIADIPSFVPYGSLTNYEAIKREENLYLKDKVVLSYPERISHNLCSLLPNNNRNVITTIFKLDSNYELIEDDIKIVKGKIRVTHKLSHKEVDDKLSIMAEDPLTNTLKDLAHFAIKRRKNTKNKEKYRELENLLKPRQHHESLQINTSLAANIVHESMVLINHKIPKYFKETGLPFLYRKVTFPKEKELMEHYAKLKTINDSLLEDPVFKECIRASLIESCYCSTPSYHEGVQQSCYAHASSPIRRASDSLCQYLIYDLIFNQNLKNANLYDWENRINELAVYLNQKKEENDIFIKEYYSLLRKNLIRK